MVVSRVWAAAVTLLTALFWQQTGAAARAPCTPGLTVDWWFHAGAPVATAARVAAGPIYLATVDGGIQALSGSGQLLWSYTVEGGLPWGLDDGPSGSVFAFSGAGTGYSLSPQGKVTWTRRGFWHPTGRPARSASGLVFVPVGRVLRATTVHSGAAWGIDLGANIASGPVLDDQGRAWLTSLDGTLHRVKNSYFHKRFALPAAAASTLVVADLQVAVLQNSTLFWYDLDGNPAGSVDDVSFVDEQGKVAVGSDNRLRWLSASSHPLAEADYYVEGAVSDAPRVLQAQAYVPTADGSLWVVGRDGRAESCRISSGPLFTPVVLPGNRVLVTAGDGTLAVVRARSSR